VRSAPPKPCARCGRPIAWRRKWERDWDAVRYCSDRCRRARPSARDRAAEDAILEALRAVPIGRPVALEGLLSPAADPEGDRDALLDAARRLAAAGAVELLAAGRAIDPAEARGRLEVRRRRS
jgi:hypothetical protein